MTGIGKSMGREGRWVVARGWRKGGKGRDYLIDTGVLGGREILKLEKGGSCTAL